MKRLRLIAVCMVMAVLGVSAQETERVKYEFESQGKTRTYAMYLPANLKEGAPLVIYTHGYGSKSRWKKGLNAVADKEGFAVCYPDGYPDSRGKDGWNVGYPSQVGMDVDEAVFFRDLNKEVCRRFKLSEENVFMTGMSNGGDLCYQLAFTAPGLYKAYASVAGLLFEHVYMNNAVPKPVPFMEIHGDADKTSMWTGDHAGAGGWGAYVAVPIAVGEMAVANKCVDVKEECFPTLKDEKRMVTHTVFTSSPYGFDVELYRIEGGPHSWGTGDLATEEIVWRFFSRFVK